MCGGITAIFFLFILSKRVVRRKMTKREGFRKRSLNEVKWLSRPFQISLFYYTISFLS